MSEAAPPELTKGRGFARELAAFAWQHKLVWLLPVILFLLLLLALTFANYSEAPFHYTVM